MNELIGTRSVASGVLTEGRAVFLPVPSGSPLRYPNEPCFFSKTDPINAHPAIRGLSLNHDKNIYFINKGKVWFRRRKEGDDGTYPNAPRIQEKTLEDSKARHLSDAGVHADNAAIAAQRRVRFSSGVMARELEKERAARACAERSKSLWQQLHAVAARTTLHYYQHSEVAINDTHVPCCRYRNVAIQLKGLQHRIHANRIDLFHQRSLFKPASDQFYVAAQAPQTASTFDRMLVHAVESGQGLFQIVSPSEHKQLHRPLDDSAPENGKVSTIIAQLRIELSRPGKPFVFGDGYEVTAVESVVESHRCICRLTVKKDGESTIVHLTQIGLKFANAVLESDALASAKKALDDHMQMTRQAGCVSQIAPTVISHAGVGRNATLIVYHELCALMDRRLVKSEQHLDALLRNAIVKGRAARGPYFVHSEEQLLALRAALVKNWRSRDTAAIAA